MTRLSPHRICEATGEVELWCDHCDLLEHGRHDPTPLHRADRTHGTHWLDARQEKRLRDNLRDLPDRLAIAHRVIDGEKLGDPTHGVPGSRPPLSVAVLDLGRRGKTHDDPIGYMTTQSRGILTMLESWTRMAESEMLDTDTDCAAVASQPTVASECAWLLRHIVWILEQQWVTELSADVTRAANDVRNALQERAEYDPRCPQCGGWLEKRTGFFTCTACGHETPARLLLALAHPMTSDQLAEAFDVTSDAIRQWVSRGHLSPALDSDGKVMKSGRAYRYHVTDVLRLLDTSPKCAG